MEASSPRHNQLLTPFAAALSSLEDGGGAKKSKLLVMPGLCSDQPPSRCPLRDTPLEQKTLRSSRSPKGCRCPVPQIGNKDQDTSLCFLLSHLWSWLLPCRGFNLPKTYGCFSHLLFSESSMEQRNSELPRMLADENSTQEAWSTANRTDFGVANLGAKPALPAVGSSLCLSEGCFPHLKHGEMVSYFKCSH